MMKVKVFASSLVAAMGLVFAAQSAQASTVELVKNDPNNYGFAVQVSSDSGATFGGTSAGAWILNKVSDPDGVLATTSNPVLAWCLNYAVGIGNGTQTYNVDPAGLPSIAQAAALSALVDQHGAAAIDTPADLGIQASFQLAVWEIMHETSATLSLDNGLFQAIQWPGLDIGTTAISMANTWLSALGAGGNVGQLDPTYLYNANDPTRQPFMVITGEVPLPGAALLFGSALMGAGVFGRKKMAAKA